MTGFFVLGAVFLVVTGVEALYADLGHFGPGPIRLVWIAIVLPALLLNYFGQGANLLQNPELAHHPFYSFFYRSRTPTNEWDLSDVALAGSTFPLFVQKRA